MADENLNKPEESGAENRIININIEDEMKTAYIDYSMSVIVSRAIPDVRDGLKPVHRRVLYGMHELGLSSNKPHKKSARIVGEVLGKYHPHGDGSVYDAMVRMAQEWSLRYPLVDGQGNFGSIDGDSPAAMRYTEARQKRMAEEMLGDIEKETVDMAGNFDDTLEEPTVLPTRIPNLLVNGASGIAVGMATNMLPHNLTEVINGMIAYIDNKEISIEELIKYVTAPDFPTGGIIYGYSGVKEAFETGRGRVVLRGKAAIEPLNANREQIIITEIPYQINKAMLISKIADLVNEKEIEGISEVRDESDRDGMRIVIELKKDAIANIVLNKLYQYTPLQTSYGVNNIALVHGRPKMLNLKDMIQHFIEFRHDVVVRRTKFELAEAEKKAHVLEGLIIALDNIEEVIKLIRSSNNTEEAKNGLISKFSMSEIQAKAVLDMRLQKLTSLESSKLREEHAELMKLIGYLNEVLGNESLRFQIIKDELNEVKRLYGDERKTSIEFADGDINMEDLIPDENMVITISHLGYIKRTNLNEYKIQSRGGVGSKGGSTRTEDFIEHMFTASAHNYILLFTRLGRCFWIKAYEIPEANKTGKGRAIQNIINIPPDDKILTYMPIKNLNDVEFTKSHYVMFCTKNGIMKKTYLEDYSRPRANGIQAVGIREGDELVDVRLTDGSYEVVIAKKLGKALRFPEEKIREMGRSAAGVRGVTLEGEEDEVVGMICVKPSEKKTILVLSEKGLGKRSYLDDPESGEAEYRVTNRGGKGVKTINITDKTGKLIAIRDVMEGEDLMIITRSGLTVRMKVEDIKVAGRATQGVILIRLREDDSIAAVSQVPREDEEILDGTDNGISPDSASEDVQSENTDDN